MQKPVIFQPLVFLTLWLWLWFPLSAQEIHATPMAGRWFPDGEDELRRLVEASFHIASKRGAHVPPRKQLLALVVPHAGLAYSGVVAASSYRLLGKPKNVILLGFSHRRAFSGVVAPDIVAYDSPLGQVTVNRDVLEELGFPLRPEKELCDHSLENQLPFLRYTAPEATLTPLYVGALSGSALDKAAEKIAARLRKGDVVLASTDFTHYGEAYGYRPFPQDSRLPDRLRERAIEAFEEIGSLNVAAFDQFLASTGDTICGSFAVRLLMAALARHHEDVFMNVIDYMASGELTNDWSLSVGYGALAFYPASAYGVDESTQSLLLRHSRRSLEAQLDGAQPAAVPAAAMSSELMQRTGAFITIKKRGKLRGCLGVLTPRTPLAETIAERTVAASSSDPRFPPLSRKEGPVSLEISLLTPLKRLHDWRKWEPGYGAVLLRGDKGGLLLPQVAEENKWNREQFLQNLALKAGLPANAFRDSQTRLYVFRAHVFAEPENGAGNSGID